MPPAIETLVRGRFRPSSTHRKLGLLVCYGMLIPAGGALVFRCTTRFTGQAIDDRTGIGFVFARFSLLANSALSKATPQLTHTPGTPVR